MGLFGLGNKTKYVDEPDNSESTEKTEAFFLQPEEAQTLGDIDYMRKSKKIRRTFPKTKNFQGGELIKEVSAVEEKVGSGNDSSKPASNLSVESQPETNNSQASSQRRQPDNSMDMFRNMAKEMKR